MLFKFLKYISPIGYFNLSNTNGASVFPDYDLLPNSIKEQIPLDERFSTELAKKYDASWRAIHKGYIGDTPTITFNASEISIKDEYIFIRKYFSVLWVYYTFFLRIILLKNPFKEIKSFWSTKKVKRYRLYKNPIQYPHWENFQSNLLQKNPKVSVIIPTLNRYEYLKDVLHDLEKQEYKNFDVIVVDQSEPFQKEFYDSFNLDIKLIHQEEKALWLARNRAVEVSDANYLLLFDDDSRVNNDWITNHIKCLDFFSADVSSGTSISVVGAKVPESYSYFKISEQLDTGNVLIKREVFESVGLFDRQFEKQRMGDGEFGLRSYLNNFINISNPYSERLHLKVGSGGLRQMGSWDGFRPKNWFGPRPIPSVLYYFRKYYGNKLSFLSMLRTIPQSIIPYKYKGSNKVIIFAYISLLFIWPIVLFQVVKSWRLAEVKLNVGSMISKL